MRSMTLTEAYHKGFIDGLRCFAWWKDGEQYVGTNNTTLRHAEEEAETLGSYNSSNLTMED